MIWQGFGERRSLMMRRTAVLADIHGNSVALEAALADVTWVGCSRVWILGDVINGVDPQGCLDQLNTLSSLACIRGNAEDYTLTPDREAFPLRSEEKFASLFRLLDWFIAHIRVEDLEWMRTWPDYLIVDGSCLVHDSPFDRIFPEGRYVPGIEEKYQEIMYHARGIGPNTPVEELENLAGWMAGEGLTRVFCGHTHQPFMHHAGERAIYNVGSVGLPLDGDPRAAWALLEETDKRRGEVSIRRVDYDVRRAQVLVDSASDYPEFMRPGFRQAYRRTLETGIHWNEQPKMPG